MASSDELLLKKIHLKEPWSGQVKEKPVNNTVSAETSKPKKSANKNQRARAQGISL
jgi:hypothetical protein